MPTPKIAPSTRTVLTNLGRGISALVASPLKGW